MSLQERHEEILDKCVDSLKTWKQVIEQYLDGEEKNRELDKLREITKDYCYIDIDFKRSRRALQKVEDELNSDEECTSKDVKKSYEDNLRNEPEVSGEDYKDNDIWQNIFRGISDVMEVKQKETVLDESQFEELGDSLLCSNVFTPPIDPISKAVIRNPYRNRKCKHVYEYAMIVNYIRQQKRRAKCPYIGCNSKLLLITDLVEDKQLEKQITDYIETQPSEDTEDD